MMADLHTVVAFPSSCVLKKNSRLPQNHQVSYGPADHEKGTVGLFICLFVFNQVELLQKCSSRAYMSQESFLTDMNQIVENSITYNGPSSPYTQTAQRMRETGLLKLQKVSGLKSKGND